MQLIIRGVVQGVGFRPFVYRLAHELHLTGWVNNSPRGVTVEVEGCDDTFTLFSAACRPKRHRTLVSIACKALLKTQCDAARHCRLYLCPRPVHRAQC
jgi:hydrogenase maturation factor HypF (carbamoyltransferase family)